MGGYHPNAQKSLRFGCGESPDGSAGRPGEYADRNGLRLVVLPTDARFWILAFAISVLGCCFAARGEEAPVQSGNYAGLIVGYEPKRNIVSGYLHSETGNGQFNCMFYLK